MSTQFLRQRRGAAVVALMLVTTIILGSMLMLHTAAVVSVGSTSRALEIARQNAGTATRMERITREAVQSVYGVSALPASESLREKMDSLLVASPLGTVEVVNVTLSGQPRLPLAFPSLQGPPAPLEATPASLGLFCTPELLALGGPRSVTSTTFSVRYRFTRPVVTSTQTFEVNVDCRLLGVPLSRFGLMAYDLPNEIGAASNSLGWPAGIAPEEVGPRGLVPDRDPARVNVLSGGQNRPGHYRYAAALAEAYQYVFSQRYLQNAADYAGQTHFVQIGAGPANPSLTGGIEAADTYTLDVGKFGAGSLGPRTVNKDLAVIYATTPGCSLVLKDSGGATSPILLVVAGPSDSNQLPLRLQLGSSIRRPIVLVCYHVQFDAAGSTALNGAIFADRDCSTAVSMGTVSLGHLSYWAGGAIAVDSFQLQVMPASAELLAPRALYAATTKSVL